MGIAIVIALDLAIVAYFIWRVVKPRKPQACELSPEEYADQQDRMAW